MHSRVGIDNSHSTVLDDWIVHLTLPDHGGPISQMSALSRGKRKRTALVPTSAHLISLLRKARCVAAAAGGSTRVCSSRYRSSARTGLFRRDHNKLLHGILSALK